MVSPASKKGTGPLLSEEESFQQGVIYFIIHAPTRFKTKESIGKKSGEIPIVNIYSGSFMCPIGLMMIGFFFLGKKLLTKHKADFLGPDGAA